MDFNDDSGSDTEIDLSPLIAHNANNSVSSLRSPSPFDNDISISNFDQTKAPTEPAEAPKSISRRRGKKRSSRACASCRTRKVRCNIIAHGAPCSNCRHDEIDCVLPLSRRQKAARDRAAQQARQAGREPSIYEPEVENCCSQGGAQTSEPETALGPHGMPIALHPLCEILPTNSVSQCPTPSTSRPVLSAANRNMPKIFLQSPLATCPIQYQTPHNSESNFPDERLPIFPGIFAPFPKHLDKTDLLYLHRRDALTLPSEKLQILLLRAYREFVHNDIPILDLDNFLAVVKYGDSGDEKKNLSFLLFQAVMFAAVEYVSLKALKDEGYGSKETAKRVLFSRVKLLYDFDTTTDRHTIIQSLLLMSLRTHPNLPNRDHKDSYHYLGLAISLSFSLGINRDIAIVPTHSSIRKRRLERRMWWSAFVRDRVLAMESKHARSLRIRKEDSDVEMLKVEDFDLGGEDDEDAVESIGARRNAEMFVQKVRLCWWSGDGKGLILRDQNPPHTTAISQHHQPSIQTNTTPTFTPLSSDDVNPCNKPGFNLNINTTPSDPSISSPSEPCLTPRDFEIYPSDPHINEQHSASNNENNLGAGFGVDGEYDDYLEYLKGPVVEMDLDRGKVGKGSPVEVRAWGLDCDAGRIVEV